LGVRVLIVEPGAFRTEFNRNKRITEELAVYKDSAGLTRQATEKLLDTEPNDPVKGVAAITRRSTASTRRCVCYWATTPSTACASTTSQS